MPSPRIERTRSRGFLERLISSFISPVYSSGSLMTLRRKNQQNWVFSAHVRRRLFTFGHGVLLVVHSPKDPLDDDDENEQEKEEDEEDDEPALAEGWGRAGLRLSNTQCSFHLPNGGKRAFCRIAV
jgi:hypothetical protein